MTKRIRKHFSYYLKQTGGEHQEYYKTKGMRDKSKLKWKTKGIQ